MYEDGEENWETPENGSNDFETTGELVSKDAHPENTSSDEDTLVVPAKEVKGKNKKSKKAPSEKKPIPKKQMYILGGIAFAVVVIAGGGLTYAHMLQQNDVMPPANETTYHPPIPKNSSMVAPANAMASKNNSSVTQNQPSGFATLGNLPQQPATKNVHHSDTVATPTGNAMLPPVTTTSSTTPLAVVSPVKVQNTSTTSSANTETTKTSKNISTGLMTNQPSSSSQSIVSKLKEKERASQIAIAKMHNEVQKTQQKISDLESELKIAESNAGKPKIITRTVVRYVHVPVSASSIPVTHHHVSSVQRNNSISVIGGNANSAIISERDGQVTTVYRGDQLPNGEIVQSIHNGYIVTNHGDIR